MKKSVLKSVGAVLAGLITIVVLSNGTDTILEATSVFPPVAVQREQGFDAVWMVVVALIYRSIYMVVGGYVAAALAPDRPMRHAVALGIIGIALGILGAAGTWRRVAPPYARCVVVMPSPGRTQVAVKGLRW